MAHFFFFFFLKLACKLMLFFFFDVALYLIGAGFNSSKETTKMECHFPYIKVFFILLLLFLSSRPSLLRNQHHEKVDDFFFSYFSAVKQIKQKGNNSELRLLEQGKRKERFLKRGSKRRYNF